MIWGALWGLCSATLALVGEGAWWWLSGGQASGPLLSLGFGAPVALLLVGLAALSTWGWSVCAPLGDGIKTLLAALEGSAASSSSKSELLIGRLLSLLAQLCIYGVVSAALVYSAASRIVRPHWIAAAALLAQLAVLLTAVALAPAVHRLILAGLAAGRRRLSALGAPPKALDALLGLALVATLVVLVWIGSDALVALPLRFGLLPLLSAGVSLLVVVRLRRRQRVSFAKRFAGGLLTAWLGAFAVVLVAPAALRASSSAFLGIQSSARVSYRVVRSLLDFDGDGASQFFGEADCAPFDASIGPLSVETPDNGIDEDCSGRDATLASGAWHGGKLRHQLSRKYDKLPHIILISTDALSQRHTGVGGYDRPVSPNLDAWAKRATVFDAAFAAGPSTGQALPALMSGIPVAATWLGEPKKRAEPELPASLPLLANELRQLGYRTVAIPGTEVLLRWQTITRGFDTVERQPLEQARKRCRHPTVHAAPEITDRAIELVEQQGPDPLLMWIHYYDHHRSNAVPNGAPEFSGRGEVDVYDSELAFADQHWSRLIAAVERTWKPEDYIIVFTSDHGEAFDAAHIPDRHDHCLRAPETHVPFIVQTAWQRGRRVPELVSHLDLVPTLLELVGVAANPRRFGESLAPVLVSERSPEKTVLLSSYVRLKGTSRSVGEILQLSVRTNDLDYFEDLGLARRWLTRWRSDPLESADVSAEEPDSLETMRLLAGRYRTIVGGWRTAPDSDASLRGQLFP